jgi:hypothetical protein
VFGLFGRPCQAKREQGPITTGVRIGGAGAAIRCGNKRRWLWVPRARGRLAVMSRRDRFRSVPQTTPLAMRASISALEYPNSVSTSVSCSLNFGDTLRRPGLVRSRGYIAVAFATRGSPKPTFAMRATARQPSLASLR